MNLQSWTGVLALPTTLSSELRAGIKQNTGRILHTLNNRTDPVLYTLYYCTCRQCILAMPLVMYVLHNAK